MFNPNNKLHINKIENILKFSDLLFEFESLYKKCIAIVRSEKIKFPENQKTCSSVNEWYNHRQNDNWKKNKLIGQRYFEVTY